ncbi:MAG: hypothetical protein HEQ39_10450 [Rhizobacter sp.]
MDEIETMHCYQNKGTRIPTKAGIQVPYQSATKGASNTTDWIPAFAGMTVLVTFDFNL